MACDVPKALELFQRADRVRPNDPGILHEISKQLSDSVEDAPTEAAKISLAQRALAYSERAEKLAPRDPLNLVSIAVCYGRLAQLGSNRARIEATRQVVKYAEAAVALDPRCAWAHHVLGECRAEIMRVSSTLRTLARVFYGGLPEASWDSAIAELKQAVALDPDNAAHELALGLAYSDAGYRDEARAHLTRGLTLPTREIQEQRLKAKAAEQLKKL